MNCVDFLFSDEDQTNDFFVLGRNDRITFFDLQQDVYRLAKGLKNAFGVGNKFVLLSSNSIFFIVSYLAVMKSGNVVIPLNPALKEELLEYIKEHANVKLAFISKLVKSRIQLHFDDVWDEDRISQVIKGNNKSKINATENIKYSNRLAQIIYTSGSTAMPKGVVLSHKNIVANTTSIIAYLKLTSNDIMEVVLPFFYCYGLSLLHTHLKVKGKIVLNNNFIFIGSVIKDLKEYRCTGFAGVPSHFQILLRKADHFINDDFPHLKYVTQAGGKLHPVFIKEFLENKPEIDFIVMYGQTEATARLSFLPKERLVDKIGSIGKGIPGVQLKVIDKKGRPVKVGEVGEIIAKGDNIMLGYYEDKDNTEVALKDGWLYTGDLATVDEDGYIYHAARKKEIIKVGGNRVSPKEIEEVIVSLSGVIDCTVVPVYDDILGEAIKAIIVKNVSSKDLTTESVKAFCSKKLASFKIPQTIEFTNKLNVNAAGKKIANKL